MLTKNEIGILLVAVRHAYYGRLAYNFACSLRAVDKDFPIAILHSGTALSHLSEGQKKIFTHITEIPDGDALGIGAKLYGYDFTPFQRTLQVDADNLWLPKHNPIQIFDDLKGIDFLAITEGFYDTQTDNNQLNQKYFLWADPKEIAVAYDIHGKIFQLRSEAMYYELGDKCDALFGTAQEVQKNPRVAAAKFAGGVPDELCLNIACAVEQLEPVKKWNPVFWDRIENSGRRMPLDELYEKYYMMSTGGNLTSPFAQKLYNSIAGAACHKLGVQYLFTLQSKKRVLAERKAM